MPYCILGFLLGPLFWETTVCIGTIRGLGLGFRGLGVQGLGSPHVGKDANACVHCFMSIYVSKGRVMPVTAHHECAPSVGLANCQYHGLGLLVQVCYMVPQTCIRTILLGLQASGFSI